MSERIDTKNHPTVKALIDHCSRLGVTDAVFAQRYIGISKTTWSQLKSSTYPAQDLTPMIEACEKTLRMLADQAEAESRNSDGEIIDLSHVAAGLQAVKDCYGERQNRLILFLGETGAGKTKFQERLRQQYLGAAICVSATESWRSYYYSLIGVAEGLGLADTSTNQRDLESEVFTRLRLLSPILVIDEGHDCGPRALNMIKAVLNKTPARVVLIGTPALWDRLQKRAHEEAKQLRRRTFAKIVVDQMSPSNCRAFCAKKMPGFSGLGAEQDKAIQACCETANKFGLYDTLERICKEMRREMGDSVTDASFDRVSAAIKRVEALNS